MLDMAGCFLLKSNIEMTTNEYWRAEGLPGNKVSLREKFTLYRKISRATALE